MQLDQSLELRADPAARITFALGWIVWTLLAVSFSLAWPRLSGLCLIGWALLIWYSWRLRFSSSILVTSDRLTVATPVRHFTTSWPRVRNVDYLAHIHVHTDTVHFRIPQYSRTQITKAIARHSILFADRARLEAAITDAWHSTKSAPDESASSLKWILPSKWQLAMVLVGGVALELAVWTIT